MSSEYINVNNGDDSSDSRKRGFCSRMAERCTCLGSDLIEKLHKKASFRKIDCYLFNFLVNYEPQLDAIDPPPPTSTKTALLGRISCVRFIYIQYPSLIIFNVISLFCILNFLN